ncbi:TonB-dependent receptor plug domain-containing protein [Luteibaculum oceani]|uniref:TonB-dependent receptor n=1 Tax=Luteibaculum oceani TaxID=1294296 RepID=A0A5C6V9Y9_9FLAO|nr:TonB-dependent receptor [Luteibaculum oceani]TXC81554.1 hypothetical protein FRX97_05980 [Luteibaculum oceani]
MGQIKFIPFKATLVKFSGLILLSLLHIVAFGQANSDSLLSTGDLRMMSLDQLMNMEVTSISNNPEKISQVASAIQVINNEEIVRSSAIRLPEAVALATNLQSTQVNSHDFGITARGFNGLPSAGGILANKLLVLSDGRSIYTPILGGVYWDVQNYILQDIDRIEVVSGPGGTLWGANAVNGVINIVSKSAEETQGLYASSSIGTYLERKTNLRYGFKSGKSFVRVYGQFMELGSSFRGKMADTSSISDRYDMYQAGFRLDRALDNRQNLTVQGDLYTGTQHAGEDFSNTDGANILGRYSKEFNNGSDLRIQGYYDYVWRGTPRDSNDIVQYQLNTYELDAKYRFKLNDWNNVMVGVLYQLREDQTAVTATTNYIPRERSMQLYSVFFQDEITVIPDVLKATIGSKFLHNVFTGFEVQPSARLNYSISDNLSVWGAISRAVRLPSRFDSDITVGGDSFDSEKLLAYELGSRWKVSNKLSLSFAGYINNYDDLRSLDVNTNPDIPYTVVLANSQRAESKGFELFSNLSIMNQWRIRAGYSFFENVIDQKSQLVLAVSEPFESVDPKHTFRLQSISNIGENTELDVLLRVNSKLRRSDTQEEVRGYTGLDIRLARKIESLRLSLVGTNLLKPHNPQAGLGIPRSVFLRIEIGIQ